MSITYFYCLFVCVYNKSLYRPSEIHYSIMSSSGRNGKQLSNNKSFFMSSNLI